MRVRADELCLDDFAELWRCSGLLFSIHVQRNKREKSQRKLLASVPVVAFWLVVTTCTTRLLIDSIKIFFALP
jgi:hypothetical protein